MLELFFFHLLTGNSQKDLKKQTKNNLINQPFLIYTILRLKNKRDSFIILERERERVS